MMNRFRIFIFSCFPLFPLFQSVMQCHKNSLFGRHKYIIKIQLQSNGTRHLTEDRATSMKKILCTDLKNDRTAFSSYPMFRPSTASQHQPEIVRIFCLRLHAVYEFVTVLQSICLLLFQRSFSNSILFAHLVFRIISHKIKPL